MEWVKVFDENFQWVGEDTRENVHRQGKWHETFHCWFVDRQFIYVQKRSDAKNDFPSLFDITAAGHLEATETIEGGVREIEEELGVKVQFSQLTSVGVVQDIIDLPGFQDYEFAHVFLYVSSFEPTDFTLQEEEVDSIHAIKKEDFIRLCSQEVNNVRCRNIMMGTVTEIGLVDFVPHHINYFEAIAKKLVFV
ncbi:NUDIX hydrolase [Sporosarcina ureilytica]|uniref:Nudix hydrolase domain-containing protein n=1 Tax=Sporosarcina ureilytica TaxID=298596 RepID=A0A1D8JCA7_9BACL|nr:NUDIX domain-containing protein [Sporosarcina ureilytica]AOV06346.1 hypothetical protein BI350_01085 [Sporosarcina ureilytica]